MRTELKSFVLLIGLVVVVALAIPTTMADHGMEAKDDHDDHDHGNAGHVKLKIACTAPGGSVDVNNIAGNATPGGNCTVNGNSTAYNFTNNSNIDIKIMAAAGVNVSISILDNVGNNKYEVGGNASNDSVTYTDNMGNDKLEFNGKGGTNSLTVLDAAGNDSYEASHSSLNVTDGAGNDEYEGEHISMFMFNDAFVGDKDNIEVETS